MTQNEIRLTNVITEMFLRYPSAAKTSADQVRVYVEDLRGWPDTVVSRAVDAVRKDHTRNRAFPPSVDEIIAKLRVTGMSPAEVKQRVSLSGHQSTKQIGAQL